MTVQQASKQLLFQLYHIYEDREAGNIADLVMENITGWKRIDRVMNKAVTLSRPQQELLAAYIPKLLAHTPVQYVLHESWFYGMKLYVDENVLIPRPETEELVEWICTDASNMAAGRKFLDVGTGSGCIALGLKKRLPLSEVYACDISEPALAVATTNAASLDYQIQFVQSDFLDTASRLTLPGVDVIVSNPPYIPMKDQEEMKANVLLHEPHLALFVDDQNPLLFYQAIAAFAVTNLREGGDIYVEIHEALSLEVKALFHDAGLEDVELRKDMQGKHRMVRARLHLKG